MSWIVAIALALAAFAVVAVLFRAPRKSWTLLLAALALGLAGYGLQASPGLPGAPKAAQPRETDEAARYIEIRQELTPAALRSRSNYMITADAFARRGQYENAAALLRGVVHNNPRDGEAWLALANALQLQAEGELTPAAVLAYRSAAAAQPDSAGPSFFVGLTLIGQGEVMRGRDLWATQLSVMPPDAPGRAFLADRLTRLDDLLKRMAEQRQAQGQGGTTGAPAGGQ